MTLSAAALLMAAACGPGEDPFPGSPGLGDPLYPGLGNGGYEVTHYTVTLDVDVDRNFVSGQAVIEANATQALSSFNLDMRGLEVLETLVSDRPAEHSRQRRRVDHRAGRADTKRGIVHRGGRVRGTTNGPMRSQA